MGVKEQQSIFYNHSNPPARLPRKRQPRASGGHARQLLQRSSVYCAYHVKGSRGQRRQGAAALPGLQRGSVYCAHHVKGSRGHRRPRARSSARRLYALRLPRKRQPRPVAATRTAATLGDSVYCASDAKGNQEVFCTAPAWWMSEWVNQWMSEWVWVRVSESECEWVGVVSEWELWVSGSCEWVGVVSERELWVSGSCEWVEVVSEWELWVSGSCEWLGVVSECEWVWVSVSECEWVRRRRRRRRTVPRRDPSEKQEPHTVIRGKKGVKNWGILLCFNCETLVCKSSNPSSEDPANDGSEETLSSHASMFRNFGCTLKSPLNIQQMSSCNAVPSRKRMRFLQLRFHLLSICSVDVSATATTFLSSTRCKLMQGKFGHWSNKNVRRCGESNGGSLCEAKWIQEIERIEDEGKVRCWNKMSAKSYCEMRGEAWTLILRQDACKKMLRETGGICRYLSKFPPCFLVWSGFPFHFASWRPIGLCTGPPSALLLRPITQQDGLITMLELMEHVACQESVWIDLAKAKRRLEEKTYLSFPLVPLSNFLHSFICFPISLSSLNNFACISTRFQFQCPKLPLFLNNFLRSSGFST